MKLAEIRKLLVYVVTVAGEAVSLGLLHGDVLHYVNAGIALLGGVGIYALRNQPADAPAYNGAHVKPVDVG